MLTVLDKSYAKGTSKEKIETFTSESSNVFLLCDSFLFEVNKMPNAERAVIYKKLERKNGKPSYKLLPNINKLLKHELEKNKPLVPQEVLAMQTDNRLDHSNLSDESFTLTQLQISAMNAMRDNFGTGAKAVILTCEKNHDLFKSYIKEGLGSDSPYSAETIAASHDSVRRMLELLIEDSKEQVKTSIDLTKVSSDWFFYRYAQLFSIVCTSTLKRYPNLEILKEKPNSFKKLVNDYRDLEYILWASYIGDIKTEDAKLKDWLNILTTN